MLKSKRFIDIKNFIFKILLLLNLLYTYTKI